MVQDDGHMAAFVREITGKEFEQAVINASQVIPVIVDFWAPWCGPCKQLGPALEKFVAAANGAVQMVKVNVDDEKTLAMAVGIQSIPMVYAFYQGKAVDSFSGVRPESEINIEQMARQAEAAFGNDDIKTAAAGYARVLEVDSGNLQAITGYLRSLVRLGEYGIAEEFAENLDEGIKKDPQIETSLKALRLAIDTGGIGDKQIEKLRKKLTKKKKDLQAYYDLAQVLFVRNEAEEAIELLLESIAHDKSWEGEKARAQLLEFFDILGPSHSLAEDGRRRLSSIWFL